VLKCHVGWEIVQLDVDGGSSREARVMSQVGEMFRSWRLNCPRPRSGEAPRTAWPGWAPGSTRLMSDRVGVVIAVVMVVGTVVSVPVRLGEATVGSGAGAWKKVPFARTGFAPGSRVASVTAGGPGLVAVGLIHQPQAASITAGV
jgi:hypothetical protein